MNLILLNNNLQLVWACWHFCLLCWVENFIIQKAAIALYRTLATAVRKAAGTISATAIWKRMLNHCLNLVIHQQEIFFLASYSYALYPLVVVFGLQRLSWNRILQQLKVLGHEKLHTIRKNKYIMNMNCEITITIKHTICSPDPTLVEIPIWLRKFTFQCSLVPNCLWVPTLCLIFCNPKIWDSCNIRDCCSK
jgi:hypothetical protein